MYVSLFTRIYVLPEARQTLSMVNQARTPPKFAEQLENKNLEDWLWFFNFWKFYLMIFFSKIIRGMYSYGVNCACYLRWNLMTLFMQLASLIQWSRSRGFRRVFFETLYFSNQKSFSLDLLGFAHDFSNPRFLEIPDGILRTNSASFQKFALDFSNLKIREPRKTGPSQMYYWLSL